MRREAVKVFPSSACHATMELWHVDGPPQYFNLVLANVWGIRQGARCKKPETEVWYSYLLALLTRCYPFVHMLRKHVLCNTHDDIGFALPATH